LQLTITGRHVEITDALKAYVEKKIEKLKKYSNNLVDIHVIMEVEKKGQSVEIILNDDGTSFNSKETTVDMYESIDGAINKIESQLKKYREKLRTRKIKTSLRVEEGVEEEVVTSIEDKIIARKKIGDKPLSIEEAIMHLEKSKAVFFAFINQNTSQVNVLYCCGDGKYKLLEP
jgi:putative sigma-54 modulation protein